MTARAGGDTVAFLGTGTMGFPMARNAAAAGLVVRAWNRSRDRATPLSEKGVTVTDTPAEAVDGAAIVVTMMTDASAVLEIAERSGAFETARPGTVWAQMSTIGIEGIERCAEIARGHELELVDAPVSGTRQPAEAGELTVLAAGPPAALERCEPLFDAVGSRTVRLGEVGEATRLKLVLNNWVVTLVEATAETMALAEGLGLDPAVFLETIPEQFKLALALKDAQLVREAAQEAGLDLALTEAVIASFERAVELGHGEEDVAAAYLASAPRRG